MYTFEVRRGARVLLGIIALGGAVLLSLLIAGFTPWSPSGSANADIAHAAQASCSVSYGALDPADQTKTNPNKEVPAAIGPAVTQRDEAGIKAELQERRTCGTDGKFDPELTATHYADWSNAKLTSRTVESQDIDAFRAELISNPTLYASTVKELTSLENASAFSIQENVPAGVWSVYVLPDGKGALTTHIGTSSHVGTAAVFTHGDAVIKYRLECGFQLLRETPPPGAQLCDYAECGPPPPPVTTCEERGDCPPPSTCEDRGDCPPSSCPPGQHGTPPVCKDDPSEDPWQNGNAPTGGGPNADPGPGTYVPPSEVQQPPAAPYVPPAPPVAPPAQPQQPDPAPAPPPEQQAPTPSDPAQGCSPAPGMTTC